MRHIITPLFAVALAACAFAEEYTLTGERWLRKYSADRATPVYNTQIDAARIVKNLCNVPWTKSDVGSATLTYHDSALLNTNVILRENYDAALFCAYHANATHVAYANAACYRIDLGDGNLPRLTSLSVSVYSDPYNANGARISLLTSDSGTIPTDCATVRGDVTGGIRATNVAKRVTVTSGGKDTWYPASTNLVFGADRLGASGIQLKRYLFVFVLMENYSTVRADWLEGSSFIDNEITITTSAALPGTEDVCDVAEPYATTYNLKNGHAGDDDDGDGLSNYAEYLISEVFRMASLSVTNATSDGATNDYFRKVGELYLGEVFTDHDGIDDASERSLGCAPYDGKHFANAGIYDPERDADQDGWSNFAEFMAGTGLDDSDSHPVPRIAANVTYSGRRREKMRPLIFRAWSESDDMTSDMTSHPDAEWSVSSADLERITTFELSDPSANQLGIGHVREGKNKFVVFADLDGSGEYTAGEPFGFVRGVDVGWQGASLSVDLTDTHPVFARIFFAGDASGSNDRTFLANMSDGIRTNSYGVESAPASESGYVRVRVVRTAVNGTPMVQMLNPQNHYEYAPQTVVMDKVFNTNIRSYLHEGDFIEDGRSDIDWGSLKSDADRYTGNSGWGWPADTTNVTYRIVFGEGIIDSTVTNLPTLKYMVDRQFDSTSSNIEPSFYPYEYVTTYNTRPVFRWAVTDGANSCNSYTAFRLQVVNGSSVVYDSGVFPMPKYELLDGFRYYVWTAPSIIGNALTTNGIVSLNSQYDWKVAVYNSKFRDGRWSESDSDGQLTTAVNATQESNDHGYSSIPVTVRYAGPTNVLAKSAMLTTLQGKVRVQAFATADFSGEPIGETVVTNALTDLSTSTSNGRLYGLPKGGSYYLRAFIDMNGNRQKDNWESWGAAKAAAAVGTTTPVGIWIEDADTDDDWLPDAYEYVRIRWRDIEGFLDVVGKDASGAFNVSETLRTAVENKTLAANILGDRSGTPLTAFTYDSSAELALGTNIIQVILR